MSKSHQIVTLWAPGEDRAQAIALFPFDVFKVIIHTREDSHAGQQQNPP